MPETISRESSLLLNTSNTIKMKAFDRRNLEIDKVKNEIDMIETKPKNVEKVILPPLLPVEPNSKSDKFEPQSHLLVASVKRETKYVSPSQKLRCLRGNLGTKMKTKRARSIQNTPEKSEIAKMFEKIRNKNEKKVNMEPTECSAGTSNMTHALNSKTNSGPTDRLIDGPKLGLKDHLSHLDLSKDNGGSKLSNKSKFEAIRSIFENNSLIENVMKEAHKSPKSKSLLSLNDCMSDLSMKNPDKLANSSAKKWSIIGHNPNIIASKNSLNELPNSRLNAASIASNRSVVRQPNPKKSGPNRDIKKSSTPGEKRKRSSFKSQAESNQIGSIRKFLEEKKNTVRNIRNDGESNPVNKNEKQI